MRVNVIYIFLFLMIHLSVAYTDESLFLLSETGSGRATAYAETNKIVTIGNKTHASWLDSESERFLVRIRTYDHLTKTWSPSYTIGEAYDNHGGPALTYDSEGYLHIVYYPHHHPFRYRRSQKPNDASAWSDETRFGSRCTYPSLVCDKDDTLYLVCRESSDGKWKINFYSKQKGQDWSKPISIFNGDAEGGYARFQASLALGNDGKTLHLAFMSYERDLGEKGYLIGYMQSSNGGKTWRHRNGRELILPANPGTVELVEFGKPEFTDLNLRMGSIAIDTDDEPWIIYSHLHKEPFNTFLATVGEDGNWIKKPLHSVIQKHFPGRSVQTPGSVMFAEGGAMYIAVTTVIANSDYENSFWGDPSDEVALLVSKDNAETVKVFSVSKPDNGIPNWLPSLQRPTNPSPVKTPYLMYTYGFRGDNNKEIMSNKVYWCDIPSLISEN